MPTTANAVLRYPDQTSTVDVAADMATLADDADVAFGRLLTASAGRLAATAVQTLTAGAAITLPSDWAQGGVTYSAANGGGLAVGTTGVYVVLATVYLTGGVNTGTSIFYIRRWRAGASVYMSQIRINKPDANDVTGATSAILKLEAGDIVTMYASGTTTLQSWGSADKYGTSLQVAKIAAF